MPRLQHGKVVTLEDFQEARESVREISEQTPLGFLTAREGSNDAVHRDGPHLRERRDVLMLRGKG